MTGTMTKTTSGTYTFSASYALNKEHNGIEISFSDKPGDIIRDELKKAGYKWHNVKKVWYARNTSARLDLAQRLASRADKIEAEKKATRAQAENKLAEVQSKTAPFEIAPATFVDGGGLYDGWAGGNARTWNSEQELKAFLLADFKRAGISATVRFNRSGYLTSLTVTIKIASDEIASYEDFKKVYQIPCSGWLYYTDENGRMKDIFADQFWSMTDRDDLSERITRTAYDRAVKRLTDSGCSHGRREDVLTDGGNRKLETVVAIVNSYNRDCSNSMIDYFDRDIYDHYTFKIA